MKTIYDDAAFLAEEVPSWTFHENALEKMLVFQDFSEAFSFITRVALLSEQLNHHPMWSNVYNEVHISLSTHDAGGVTSKDLEMARRIDEMLEDD